MLSGVRKILCNGIDFREKLQMKAIIISILIAALGLSNTACIGRMAVSAKVMKFNLEVTESKWGREMVFLVLYIIPVYEFAGLVDLIVVNSIEFWTGTNPVNGQPGLARVGDQKHVIMTRRASAIFGSDESHRLVCSSTSAHFERNRTSLCWNLLFAGPSAWA